MVALFAALAVVSLVRWQSRIIEKREMNRINIMVEKEFEKCFETDCLSKKERTESHDNIGL